MKKRSADYCQNEGKTQTSAIAKYFCSGWKLALSGWAGQASQMAKRWPRARKGRGGDC